MPKNKFEDRIELKLRSFESKFNIIMLGMLGHINDYYSGSGINDTINLAKKIVKTNPEEPIAYFIKCVYSVDNYRHGIIKGNDSFYMGQQYSNVSTNTDALEDMIQSSDTWNSLDVSTQLYVKNRIKHVANNMFQFKDTWQLFDIDTQSYIKNCMKGMIEICRRYILSLPTP